MIIVFIFIAILTGVSGGVLGYEYFGSVWAGIAASPIVGSLSLMSFVAGYFALEAWLERRHHARIGDKAHHCA